MASASSSVGNVVNIAILEDDPLIQQRFSKILHSWPRLGELTSFSNNYALATANCWQQIDVLLADIGLTDGSGIDSIVRMSEHNPRCLTIVISAMSDANTVMNAIEAGAVGYLQKDDLALGVIASIELALNDGAPISPAIARKIMQRLDKTKQEPRSDSSTDSAAADHTPPAPLAEQLTKREHEVLTVLAKGYSYAETAEILAMASSTLPVHVRNIYRKLQANNRTQALTEAKFLGLID